MSSRRYHVVFNPKSGAALSLGLTADRLEQSFAASGLAATIDADDSQPLEERIRRGVESDAEVVVSAGGDGTATALAAALVDSGKTLAVLPLGTANLLARDLGVPLDLDATVAALGEMQPRLIDVGEVNGRIFLHKVVLGVVPGIAAAREQVRGRRDPAAVIGFVRYFMRRLTRARRMAIAITSLDTNDRIERVQAIAVANNAYDEGFGRLFSRTRLDTGQLTLYVLRHLTFADVLRLGAEMFAGRWQEDEGLGIESVRGVTIDAKRAAVQVMIDGEIAVMPTPLVFRTRPLALSVLAPVPVAVADETQADAVAVVAVPEGV